MEKIDTSLYSRQIGAFGIEMMLKITQLNIFISGLRGVGIETAKNLILAGPNSITLHDDNKVSLRDLGTNQFLSFSDINHSTRAQASFKGLHKLNPKIKLSIKEGEITETYLLNFDVVFFSESDLNSLIKFNQFCRNNGQKTIGFIFCESWGAAGHCFVDFGDNFYCFNQDGEKNKRCIVSDITQASPGIFTVCDLERPGLEDGDFVVFEEVEGMAEINNCGPFEVKKISAYKFSIGDTSSFSRYTRGGIVNQIKLTKTLNFRSLHESLLNPLTNGIFPPFQDFSKFNRFEQLHIATWAIREFQKVHQNLPDLHNEFHSNEILILANEINSSQKLKNLFCVEEIEENVIRLLSSYAKAQLSPIVTFWGGIIAQEILKFTGKFTPVQQWLHIDFFDIVPDCADRTVKGSRYDDQISIIGNDVHNKLAALNVLIVGAGAAGSEVLKMYALMGISTGGGELVIADNDFVSVPNLNQHSLFTKTDVGCNKSDKAALAVREINSEINIFGVNQKVCPDNESIFNDFFWKSKNVVISTVDNIQTKSYLDSCSVWYEKTLIDIGILGLKANSQICIPRQTDTYGDTVNPQELRVSIDTLINFPSAPEHCIEWAKNQFDKIFTEYPEELNKFLENPSNYLSNLASLTDSSFQKRKLEMVKNFEGLLKFLNFEECVKFSLGLFYDFSFNRISYLIRLFPIDFITSHGDFFWSEHRRAPLPLSFDFFDLLHLDFIVSAANLIARVFGLAENRDRNQIREIVRNLNLGKFVVEFKMNEENEIKNDVSILLMEMQSLGETVTGIKVNPIVFEKDDDNNFHIDFITQYTNLRARNYRIPESTRIEVKLFAGKIIPNVITTTATITGIATLELYKLMLHNDIEKFRNSFINLGVNMHILFEPNPIKIIKDKEYDYVLMGPCKTYPKGFSTWDKLHVQGPCTLQEFIDIFANLHKLKVITIECRKTLIYAYGLFKYKHENRLGKVLHELYEELSGKKIIFGTTNLAVEVACEGLEDKCDYLTPIINYSF